MPKNLVTSAELMDELLKRLWTIIEETEEKEKEAVR